MDVEHGVQMSYLRCIADAEPAQNQTPPRLLHPCTLHVLAALAEFVTYNSQMGTERRPCMSNHSNPFRVDHVLSEACMLQWQQSKPLLHLTHIAQTTMRIGGQLSSVTQRLLGCNTVPNGRVAAATAPDVEPPSFVSATSHTSKGLCLQNIWATWSLAALDFAAQTDHLIWPQNVPQRAKSTPQWAGKDGLRSSTTNSQ